MTGKIYLVGAGPGAPDLLTLRASRLLQQADAVLYDALVHPEVVALARQAKKIPVGKRCGRHSADQQFINKLLVETARQYPVVVRLKGGDPMLFGRAHEELEALTAAGIFWEVVPGITAASAASAELGVSLTRRGMARSVAFLTHRVKAGAPPSEWLAAAQGADTVAFYMAGGTGPQVAAALLQAGKSPDTPVVWVESASLPEQRRHATTLGRFSREPPESPQGPALLLVGEVYRECLAAEAGNSSGDRTDTVADGQTAEKQSGQKRSPTICPSASPPAKAGP